MWEGSSNRTLVIGLVVSVVAHLATALAFFYVESEAGGSAFHHPERDTRLEDRIELGDPESDAISMSWLGFEDYKEHVATPSEVEQAELTMDPSASASGSMTAAQAMAAMQQMQQMSSQAQAEAQRALREMAEGLAALESLAGVLPSGDKSDPRPPERDAQAEREQGEETPAETQAVAEAESQEQEQAETAAQTQATQVAAGAEGQMQSQRPVDGESGQQDDRESDATSIDRKQLGDPGRPITARGLRIRTVKPRFSHYTSIMTNPGSPVVRIHFDSRGQAALVDLMESSGNPDIDRPVLDAAYRWTAQGEALTSLSGSETIFIDVRILL